MGEIENNHETTVQITLKTIGPAPPSRIEVHDLRKLIARNGCFLTENLRIFLQGKVLPDNKNGVDEFIQLNDGDSLIVAVKPPVQHIQDGLDDDDDDNDLKFQLPHSTSGWKRRFFSFLHDKLRLPDMILMAIFSLSLKMWAVVVVWFILAPVAYRWDLGPLYILGTGFTIIFLNLGQRQHGDISAYSIFNEDFREIPGTLNADSLDRGIRTVHIPSSMKILERFLGPLMQIVSTEASEQVCLLPRSNEKEHCCTKLLKRRSFLHRDEKANSR